MPTTRSAYIDLLKKCLSGQIQDPGQGTMLISRQQCATLLAEANALFESHLAPSGHSVESFLTGNPALPSEAFIEDLRLSLNGMHRDLTPDSMSPAAAMDNLQACVETVLADGVPGDLIETGVWKGGLPVLMRGILKAHGVEDRAVWAADSFEGLPRPDPEKNLKDAIWFHLFSPLDGLKIPYDFVEGVFRKYDLLDGQVRLLKGWFSETLPTAPVGRLAVMRLDGDWYESTRTALEALYPRLSPGGFAIIDDYGLPFGCRKAVDEYREKNGIDEPMEWVNQQVAFWRRGVAA